MLSEVIKRIEQESRKIFQMDLDPIIHQEFAREHPCSIITKLRVIVGSRELNLFVKTYRFPELKTAMEKMLREYGVLVFLNQRKELSLECPVISPLACFPDLQTIITEEYPGEAFNKVLKRGTKLFSNSSVVSSMENYCRLCGEWLRSFQKVANHIDGRPYIHDDTIADIKSNLQISVQRMLLTKNQSDLLTDIVDSIASLTPNNIPLSGMHSDFIPSNIIINENRVTALDFADFRKGPIYRDPITFLHALENYLWNPLVRPKIIRSLQKHFLLGYGVKIQIEDIPLVIIMEIRQILGELVNLPITIRKRWFSTVVYQRARRMLIDRLLNLAKNAGRRNNPYRICGVTWEVSLDKTASGP